MLKARISKHSLQFKRPGGTSRGVLTQKDSWFLTVWDESRPGIKGIGECSIIRGLSPDPWQEFDSLFEKLTADINNHYRWMEEGLQYAPAVRFALETALKDLENGGRRLLFPSDFTAGKTSIPINGLIWMGDPGFMQRQITQKIENGFRCIKLKIGALDFESEMKMLCDIRKQFPAGELELRVDANGGFGPEDAPAKLNRLAELEVHSIEQPIRPGQWEAMAGLCAASPVPVALDEELIGINSRSELQSLLETVRPQYLILKPSLLGGWARSEMFIREAEKTKTGWWVTSALESNIGLNAIAQWTATLGNPLPQGLGTGQLFANNIPSPLQLRRDRLFYDPQSRWDLSLIK